MIRIGVVGAGIWGTVAILDIREQVGTQAILVPAAIQAIAELQGRRVTPAILEPRATLGLRVTAAIQGCRATLGIQATQGHLAIQAILEHLAILARLEFRAILAIREHLVLLATLVRLVRLAILDTLVPVAHQAIAAIRATLGRPGLQDALAIVVRRDIPAIVELRDTVESLVLRATLAIRGSVASLEPAEHLATQDIQATRATQELRDILDLVAHQDLAEPLLIVA